MRLAVRLFCSAGGALFCGLSVCAQSDLDQRVNQEVPALLATYKHLHENPELSTQEKETAALVAADLRKSGYEVTDHFGQYAEPNLVAYGIVAVLRNGSGPTVYVRTDMDALPIVENTGLPYASHVKTKRADGTEVGVMHACGHDLHMTVFLGTARVLAQLKTQWSGTVVMIGQPAEETVSGAQAMLKAGLYTKFPKPDYVLALHDSAVVPAGKVSWHAGDQRGDGPAQQTIRREQLNLTRRLISGSSERFRWWMEERAARTACHLAMERKAAARAWQALAAEQCLGPW